MPRPLKDRRHRAREAALQILYQWEVGRIDIEGAAETFFGQQWPDREPPTEALRTFASALARDTVARLGEIDPLIAETTERWRPPRIAVPDPPILRIAAGERPHPRDPIVRQGEFPRHLGWPREDSGLHPPGLAAGARFQDLQAARFRRLGRRRGTPVPDEDQRAHDLGVAIALSRQMPAAAA